MASRVGLPGLSRALAVLRVSRVEEFVASYQRAVITPRKSAPWATSGNK